MYITAQNAPKIIVFLLPIISEKIPVGISKSAEETMTTEKMLMPNAKEPVTLEKYKIAIGA